MAFGKKSRAFIGVVRFIIIFISICAGFLQNPEPVYATPSLTVTPLTWNVVGLDSNNVNAGPNNFPVGARVCNTGTLATDVTATFVWDDELDLFEGNDYINLRKGSLSSITTDIAAGSASSPNCYDYYFEVTVTRSSLAYNQTRRFHINISSSAPSPEFTTFSTPIPREIKVEHLISQNRNSTDHVYYGTSVDSLESVASGGTMSLVLGQTYYIKLDASTATQGYNQIEDFINFPNTIFQILSVSTSYSANSSGYVSNPSDKLYGDACLWDMVPTSPTYLSCIGSDGKAGGTIHTLYEVKIIGGAGTSGRLNTLIYDFSGSSFHYNSDFSSSGWTISITTPMSMTKSFNPVAIATGGSSVLSITIGNTSGKSVSGISLSDTLPSGVTFTSPAISTSCSAGSVSTAGTTLSFTNGTVQNGGCTISVGVASSVVGSYLNTTDPLLINDVDSGITASASLTVTSQTPGTGFCPTSAQTLAGWSVPSTSTNPPDKTGGVPTTLHTNVSAATAAAAVSGSTAIEPTSGHTDTYSWSTYGYKSAGQAIKFSVNTTNFRNITMSFWVSNPSTGNGPTQIVLAYSTDGTNFTDIKTITSPVTTFTQYTQNFNGLTNITGNTVFRLTASGAKLDTSQGNLLYDDIVFTGTQTGSCPTAVVPTLTKSFTDPVILLNATDVLKFTLTNPNTTQLTGVSFSDTLPAGLTVDSVVSNGCSGSLTTGSSLISLTNGIISGSSNCIIDVRVKGSEAGVYTNNTGFISSAESGTNTTATGYGTSNLTVLLAPVVGKTFSPNPVYTGKTSQLTITINNPNLYTSLSGVGFVDTFPTNLTVYSAPTTTCSYGSFSYTSGSITLSGVTLAAGDFCTVTAMVTSSVTNTSPGYENTVTVSSTNGGSSQPASDTLVVQTVHPSIGIYKEVSSTANGPWAKSLNVAPAGSVYYRITIENTGDVPLSPVSVTDVTSPNNPSVDTAIAGCSWPSVLPVASATQDPTASCILGPFSAVTGTNENTATAHGTYNGTVYNSTSSDAEYSTTNLKLEKSVTESSFSAAGNLLHYSYKVTNTGAATLTGPISITDSNTSVTCPVISTLAKDAFITCTGTYTVTAFDVSTGSVTNSAVAVTSDTTPIRSNYSVVTVYSTKPDLTVTKTNNVSGFAVQGSMFVWTIKVTNQGGTAVNFENGTTIFNDQLPTGADYANLNTINGSRITNFGYISCSVNGSKLLTCVASGGRVTIGPNTGNFSLTVEATPNSIGGLTNTSGIVDPNSSITDELGVTITESTRGNNTAANSLNVTADADLQISKTDGVEGVSAGGSINYTIVVKNNGPSSADGAVFSDPVVENITVSNVTCGSATLGAVCPNEADTTILAMQGVGIVIPTLPNGGSVTFTVTGTAGTSGSIVNKAYINVPAGISDPTTSNNLATDTDTISPVADLSITKTDGVDTRKAETTATYTIQVSNAGPTPADGAKFTDPVVSNLTVTGVTCGSAANGAVCPEVANTTIALMQGTGIVIPTLPADGNLVFTVTGTAGGAGSIVNNAAITAPAGIVDPNTSNNSASDTTTVTALTPGLTLEKTATETAFVSAGNILHYSFLVTNTGETILSGPVTIDDDKSSDETCPALTSVGNNDTNLDPNESITCSATYTITSGDVTTKSVTNTATASAGGVTSNTDSVTLNLAGLTLEKSATETFYASAGDVIHYSYVVTNVGTTALTGPVSIADDKSSNETCPSLILIGDLDSLLDIGESITCSSSYIVTSGDISAKSLTNTATASAGGASSGSDSVTLPLAELTIEKSATETTYTQIGEILHYSYLVTNSGGIAIAGPVTISDDKSTDESCPAVSTTGNGNDDLDPDESITCTATYEIQSGDITAKSVTNSATATANGITSASDSVTVQLAKLSLEKNVLESVYSSVGYVLHYTFTVTNSGTAPLLGPVSVSDDQTSDENCPAVSTVGDSDNYLDAGESIDCTSTYTIKQTDIDSGSVTNQATATAGGITSNQATKTINAYQNPLINVVKSSTSGNINAVNQSVPYRFTVTNTGNLTLTNIKVSDAKCSTSITGPSGDSNSDNILQTSETWVFSCVHLVTQEEIDAGALLSNTVTVSSDQSPSDSDTLSISIDRSPAIKVVKTSTTDEINTIGQNVPYTFAVTNVGNQTLSGVTVSDPKCSGSISGPTGDDNGDSKLQIGETWIYNCSHTVTQDEIQAGGSFSNTVTADSTESAADTNVLSIPVKQTPVIHVEKTSTISEITTAGDVIPYTFTVTNTGTVTLTGITVSDPKCTTEITSPEGDGNSDNKLQLGETWVFTCNHTVTPEEINAGSTLTNLVTADSIESEPDTAEHTITIQQNAALTLNKSATETVFDSVDDILHFTIDAKNTGNVTLTNVTISDAKLGSLSCSPANPTTLGPDETMTCSGTHKITDADLNNGFYTNTASATANPPSGPAINKSDELTVMAASKIGLAKELVSITKVSGVAGTWDVELLFHIHNYESSPDTALQVTDDLAAAFPDPTVIDSIQEISSPTLHVNSGFNGTSDQHLLTGIDSLPAFGDASIKLVIRVIPSTNGFTNTAQLTALDKDTKTIGDVSQEGDNPDPDNNGIPGDNSEPTHIDFNGNIFDPPYGKKSYDAAGLPVIEWTMNWINNTNVNAIDAEVSDPIPSGSTFSSTGISSGYEVPGGAPDGSTNIGVSCSDSSTVTTTELCYFEGKTDEYPQGRIVWKGTIGPDLGEIDPEVAINDLKIQYTLTVDGATTGIKNVAAISVDLNGDGTITSGGETNVVSVSSIWGVLPSDSSSDKKSTANKLPETGFRPNQVTLLPDRPSSAVYSSTGDLQLEIPRLKMTADILGVPLDASTGTWDIKWLSTQIGWLNGTAFPTSLGNSVLTAHVYEASGLPGPFKDLESLKWGDQVIIHDQGKRYVYEVQTVRVVSPDSQAAFEHKDEAWLTLVTCKGFNEKTDAYNWRVVVQAVLVSVTNE